MDARPLTGGGRSACGAFVSIVATACFSVPSCHHFFLPVLSGINRGYRMLLCFSLARVGSKECAGLRFLDRSLSKCVELCLRALLRVDAPHNMHVEVDSAYIPCGQRGSSSLFGSSGVGRTQVRTGETASKAKQVAKVPGAIFIV